MPANHQRRRSGIIYFRRKIPIDLRARIGASEIIISLGRIAPSEARRIVHQYWIASESVFMRLRDKPTLKTAELERVEAKAHELFRYHGEAMLAQKQPKKADELDGASAKTQRADNESGTPHGADNAAGETPTPSRRKRPAQVISIIPAT